MSFKLILLLSDPFVVLLHDLRYHYIIIFRMNQLIIVKRIW